jgi:hypothetical protein
MLHVTTCLWDSNDKMNPVSGHFDESWAEKLYRCFKRNLKRPFRFLCFVDRLREFKEPIEQELLSSDSPDYGNFTEPYKLNVPMIHVALDTIVLGNIDHLADWCFTGDRIALCRDYKYPWKSINGIALVPAGHREIYDKWRGENDMKWLRNFPWQPIDDKWPGEVISYKMRVVGHGLGNAKVVFFHGQPKADTLGHLDWVKTHWQ